MVAKYKRVLLKLSGESLAGKAGHGIDFDTVLNICKPVKELVDMGVEVAIVVGGGNFWRGRSSGSMDRTRADHMGMLATVINALGVADGLEQLGLDVRVQTAIAMQEVAEPYIRNRAVRHLEKGESGGVRLRHGQPLLLHRHRRRPAGRGDRGRRDPQGHHGGRRL